MTSITPSPSPSTISLLFNLYFIKKFIVTITINDACTPNNVEIAAAIRYELETNHSASNVDVKFKDNKVEEVSWTAPGGERITLTVTSGNLTVNIFRTIKFNDKDVRIGATTTYNDIYLASRDNTDFTKYPYVKIIFYGDSQPAEVYQWNSTFQGYVVDPQIGKPGYNNGAHTDVIAIETGYMDPAGTLTAEKAQAAIEEAKQATSEVDMSGASSSNGGDGKLPSGCLGAPAGVDVEVRNGTVYVSGTWAPGSSGSHTWGSGTGWGFNDTLYNDQDNFLVPYVFKIPEGAKSMKRTSPDSMLYDYSSWGFDQDVMGFMVDKDDVARGYAESKVLWYADAAGTILMGESVIRIDLSNLNGGKAGAAIGAGVTNTTTTSSTDPKTLAPGAHVLSTAPSSQSGNIGGNISDNIFFPYKSNDATTQKAATLTITASDGTVMYTESFTPSSSGAADAGHYFFVQVIGTGINNQTKNLPMSDKPLPAGTYTWTISGENVIGSNGGQFTITAP